MEKNPEIQDGNYDFGARNYDGRIGRWWSVDAAEDAYPGASPYSFALNTPIQALDPDGNFVIFVNGLTNVFGIGAGPAGPLAPYWGSFIQKEMIDLSDPGAFAGLRNSQIPNAVANYPHKMYVNGEYLDPVTKNTNPSAVSTAGQRYEQGYEFAKKNYQAIIAGYEAELKNNSKATLDIVTHSQGAAYGEGMSAYIAEQGKYKVNNMVHLQPAEAKDIFKRIDLNSFESVNTRVELRTTGDLVANKLGQKLWGHVIIREHGRANPKMDISTYDYGLMGGFIRTWENKHNETLDFTGKYSYSIQFGHAARWPGIERAKAIRKAVDTGIKNK